MKTLYECRICDVLDPRDYNLCAPHAIDSRRGDGRPLAEKVERMCQSTRAKVEFSCEMCGRPTPSAMFVCRARPLDC